MIQIERPEKSGDHGDIDSLCLGLFYWEIMGNHPIHKSLPATVTHNHQGQIARSRQVMGSVGEVWVRLTSTLSRLQLLEGTEDVLLGVCEARMRYTGSGDLWGPLIM